MVTNGYQMNVIELVKEKCKYLENEYGGSWKENADFTFIYIISYNYSKGGKGVLKKKTKQTKTNKNVTPVYFILCKIAGIYIFA